MKNNPKRKTNKQTAPQTLVPSHEQIEIRAYQIWIASGGGHGRDVEHWLQAETEILDGSKPPMPTACSEAEDWLIMSNPQGRLIESNLLEPFGAGITSAAKPQSPGPARKK